MLKHACWNATQSFIVIFFDSNCYLVIPQCDHSQNKFIVTCMVEQRHGGCDRGIPATSWDCIIVQITIYRRLRIGRDGHLDQSETYDKS